MNVTFAPQAWADYTYWQGTDAKMVVRINELIRDVLRDPRGGIGKPERLRHDFRGYWSRRIDRNHRLIYQPTQGAILIAQCRFHYT